MNCNYPKIQLKSKYAFKEVYEDKENIVSGFCLTVVSKNAYLIQSRQKKAYTSLLAQWYYNLG